MLFPKRAWEFQVAYKHLTHLWKEEKSFIAKSALIIPLKANKNPFLSLNDGRREKTTEITDREKTNKACLGFSSA